MSFSARLRLVRAALLGACVAPWLGEGMGWVAFFALGLALACSSTRLMVLAHVRPLGTAAVMMAAARIAPLFAPGGAGLGAHLSKLLPAGVFFLVYFAVRQTSDVWAHRATQSLLFAGGIACLFGLASMIFDVGLGESLVRIDAVTWGQGRVPEQAGRVVGGFYFHRLKMAHALAVAGCWAWAYVLVPASLASQLMMGAVGSLMIVALLLTYARAACLAFGLGLGVIVTLKMISFARHSLLSRRLRVSVIMGGVIFVMGVGTVATQLPGVSARLKSSHSSEASRVRAVIWAQWVHIAMAHPLGVGLGQYPKAVAASFRVHDPLAQSPRTYPHNMVLGMWAEGGPVALIALGWSWALYVCTAAKNAWTARTRQARRAGLAGLGMGVVLAAAGLTHDVFFHQVVALLSFVALALAAAQWEAEA